MMKTLQTIFQDARPQHFNINKDFCLLLQKEPFDNIIKRLRCLGQSKTPLKMFQDLNQIRLEICKTIDKSFEANYPELYGNKEIQIDPDNLILILIYCIIKAKEPKILAYRVLMKEHISPNLIDSYFFATFQGALYYISNFEQKMVTDILTLLHQTKKIKIFEKIQQFREKVSKGETKGMPYSRYQQQCVNVKEKYPNQKKTSYNMRLSNINFELKSKSNSEKFDAKFFSNQKFVFSKKQQKMDLNIKSFA